MYNDNGLILWEGASLLDGKPIVVIATGFKEASSNAKTGNMIQTWILRQDVNPVDAVKSGDDASICGDCKHRGTDGAKRSCYVTLFMAPRSIWTTYKAGKYRRINSPFNIREAGVGKYIRIGSYGDPAAVPTWVWAAFRLDSLGGSGYTHQWRNADIWLSRFAMASVDSEEEQNQAKKLGWRTFRVRTSESPLLPNEIMCPASKEAGNRLSCVDCRACNGSKSRDDKRVDISIIVHGRMGMEKNFTMNLQKGK